MVPVYENILTANTTVAILDLQVQGGATTAVVQVAQTSSTGTIQFFGYTANAGAKSGITATHRNALAFTVASTGVLTTGAATVGTSTTPETYFVRLDGLALEIDWVRVGGTLRIAVGSARA